MKKALLKFADALMSSEQMRGIKGGVVYCNCPGQGFTGYPDGTICSQVCNTGGGGSPGGCEYLQVPGC